MDETFSSRLRKTAEEVAQRFNEAAQQASERIGEMREIQKLTQQIRTLTLERDKARFAIADLVIRMFDQNSFIQDLLKPDYEHIKELDVEIARLEKERELVHAQAGETAPSHAESSAAEQPPSGE